MQDTDLLNMRMKLLKEARDSGVSTRRLVGPAVTFDEITSNATTDFEVLDRMQRIWDAALEKKHLPAPLFDSRAGRDGAPTLLELVRSDIKPTAEFLSDVANADVIDGYRDPYFVVVDIRQSNKQIIKAIDFKRRILRVTPPSKFRPFLEGNFFAFLFLYQILLEGAKPHLLAWEYLLEREGVVPDPKDPPSAQVRRMKESARLYLSKRLGIDLPPR